MPPGAAAGMNVREMMPTTVSGRRSVCVTAFAAGPETTRVPEVALKSIVDPMAVVAFLKPRASAVRSVSSISDAESEPGSRPAVTVIPGKELRGGSDTSAPAGFTTDPADAPSTLNVPLIATWPHAALTCCRWPRGDIVPALKPTGFTSPDGYTATW